MNNCVFCEKKDLGSVQVFRVDEIEGYFYFWDVNPVTPGHLLITPNRHVADYVELNESEYEELGKAIFYAYKKIELTDIKHFYKTELYQSANEKSQKFLDDAIRQLEKIEGNPDGYNHGVNDGEAAGRTVDHFHYHIFPRWKGDMLEPRGGVRHFVEGKGKY